MTKYYYNRDGITSADQQILQQQQQHLHSDSRSYNPYLPGASYPMQPPPQGGSSCPVLSLSSSHNTTRSSAEIADASAGWEKSERRGRTR
jgi:hypothetical protein